MASDKTYVVATGMVQAFTKDGVKQAAVEARTTKSGQVVHGFTIKTPTQKYISVSLFEEYAAVADQIKEGYGVMVEGSYTSNMSNGKEYHNVSALRLVVIPCVARAERDVVNPVAPTAAAPVASSDAPASGFSF